MTGNGLYHPFVVILGMAKYCFTHINRDYGLIYLWWEIPIDRELMDICPARELMDIYPAKCTLDNGRAIIGGM